MERAFEDEHDYEPSYQERFPEWRSSDGALKEDDRRFPAGAQKERRDEPLTGYVGSEAEKKRKDEPRKIWELGNAYGSLAVGKNKKKQLVIVNSQKRTKRLHQLTPESKTMRRETSVKVPLISGEFRFNEDWNRRQESAYSYQLEASHSPDFLMRKMKELIGLRRLDVQKNISPFLDTDKEKEELAYLREKAVDMARAGNRDAEKSLDKRMQFLKVVLADKERQRLKMYTKLPQLLEEARKEEDPDWRFTPQASAAPAADGGEEDNNNQDGDELPPVNI